MIRRMKNTFREWTFYESSFDQETGTLVRTVQEVSTDDWSYPRSLVGLYCEEFFPSGRIGRYGPTNEEQSRKAEKDWLLQFSSVSARNTPKKHLHLPSRRTGHAFSPVPETIDVQVTNWCDQGCPYCYMSSTTKGKHAPKKLLTEIIQGLDLPPYQIAFGGGEPTSHPDFAWFLKYARENEVVPNYTTAGALIRDEVIDATNEFAGGVAITYHRSGGIDRFVDIYKKWRSLLSPRVQINIHVLFDDDVVKSLHELMASGLPNLRVVLLAYYASVGRAGFQGTPSKRVYNDEAPVAIREALGVFENLAFSEGLLPYFLSRDILPTEFATSQEGYYSCYVSKDGDVSYSSFDPSTGKGPRALNIYDRPLQELWSAGDLGYINGVLMGACYSCPRIKDCASPETHHALACAFASHNK